VAAEASLPTATQRRSLVSLARLVDYEPMPALSATTVLQCDVPATTHTIQAGTRIAAMAPDGTPIPFEIGSGLTDSSSYPVSHVWNFGLQPYWFDDSQRCWPAGSMDLWLFGHGYNLTAGQALLIQTDIPGESIRQIVHLTQAGHEDVDPIFLTNGSATPVTHIVWGPDDALTRAHDLTNTKLGGNLLPATQGQRFVESFAAGVAPPSAPGVVLAIARRGPNGNDAAPNYIYRYPLAQPSLGWLANADPAAAPQPEIMLHQVSPAARDWQFVTSLLGSLATSTDYTIDPVAWRAIARSDTGQPTQFDIDGDAGNAIRFGNNVFGASPAEQDLYRVTYRTGVGAAGNVAADSITTIDPSAAGALSAARNPFAVDSGADAETAAHIRRMAPQAFRAVQYRAVRAEDYQAAAETLPWVQKAGTSFRWTGSWMTVFTAVDPRGSEETGIDRHVQLVDLLNRRRLAGYESYAPSPRYLSVDLRVEVCVQEGWLNGDVEAGVLDRLGSTTRADDDTGFFFADRFTFGTPLYRSRLEAAIQAVPGVAGVRAVTYRQRGTFAGFVDLPEVISPAPMQILRVDNDPSWPERGTIRVIPEGGR
ncbi:MAG TPA: baseplate J/gp47 family protein, partial [Acetobacteraceae bacterium]|nr:baseplate J/gp47 family protein [Acetobacteraceae bacterium]